MTSPLIRILMVAAILAVALLPFSIVCTALYYLFARAEVTRPIWSRYRGRLDRLARCPACSGAWIGGLLALPVSLFLGHYGFHGWRSAALSAATGAYGTCTGLVLTPVGMAILKLALSYSSVPPEAEDGPAQEPSPSAR